MRDKERKDFLDKVLSQLGEHFEHVQILATWDEDGVTYDTEAGCGNWYARQGLAASFIKRDQCQEITLHLQEMFESDEDEDNDSYL